MGSYPYWQHFLALEADFAATARFVEFSPKNFGTYSIEYTKLLLAIGSEIDVLCKVICERLDPSAPRDNINDYRASIVARTKLADEEVLIRRYDLKFRPWEAWASNKNPGWWKCYNNVKHERDEHFDEANLANCAGAIAGLFAVVLYCHQAEGSSGALEPGPVLLGRDREPGNITLEAGYAIPAFT